MAGKEQESRRDEAPAANGAIAGIDGGKFAHRVLRRAQLRAIARAIAQERSSSATPRRKGPRNSAAGSVHGPWHGYCGCEIKKIQRSAKPIRARGMLPL